MQNVVEAARQPRRRERWRGTEMVRVNKTNAERQWNRHGTAVRVEERYAVLCGGTAAREGRTIRNPHRRKPVQRAGAQAKVAQRARRREERDSVRVVPAQRYGRQAAGGVATSASPSPAQVARGASGVLVRPTASARNGGFQRERGSTRQRRSENDQVEGRTA